MTPPFEKSQTASLPTSSTSSSRLIPTSTTTEISESLAAELSPAVIDRALTLIYDDQQLAKVFFPDSRKRHDLPNYASLKLSQQLYIAVYSSGDSVRDKAALGHAVKHGYVQSSEGKYRATAKWTLQLHCALRCNVTSTPIKQPPTLRSLLQGFRLAINGQGAEPLVPLIALFMDVGARDGKFIQPLTFVSFPEVAIVFGLHNFIFRHIEVVTQAIFTLLFQTVFFLPTALVRGK
ncbi:hypothetical protein B9479_007719 [Cryptococcus floricola]|uniref:Uncharacterized protein n=1 Tax=Cryptococcus floricola TaxID=2591691 RepID=A0A5D3AMR5_9TREE|nr:hypothetical protein B9479_007719 [Cryptococcus floricola]